jgi:hypothetical protein
MISRKSGGAEVQSIREKVKRPRTGLAPGGIDPAEGDGLAGDNVGDVIPKARAILPDHRGKDAGDRDRLPLQFFNKALEESGFPASLSTGEENDLWRQDRPFMMIMGEHPHCSADHAGE